jgi:hypothetical protein
MNKDTTRFKAIGIIICLRKAEKAHGSRQIPSRASWGETSLMGRVIEANPGVIVQVVPSVGNTCDIRSRVRFQEGTIKSQSYGSKLSEQVDQQRARQPT